MIVLILIFVGFLIYKSVGLIYDKYWEHRLDIEIYLPEKEAFEGESIELKEVVVNDKYLPLPTLEIDFNMDKNLRFEKDDNNSVSDKLYKRDVFYVGTKKKITRTLNLHCIKRGYVTLSKLGYMSFDIFMQNKYLGKKEFFQDLYIFPSRVATEQLSIVYNQIMGEVVSRQKIYDDPFSFAGIRDYVIGDPIKNINWKASAKTGGLLVNTCDSSISKRITVVIDTYENSSVMGNQLSEESIRIVASLCENFLAQGVNISLIGNAHDLFTKEHLCLMDLSNLGINEVRKNLARLTLSQEKDIAEYFDEIPKDTLVVFISKNESTAEKLSKISNDILWVMPYKFEEPEILPTKATVIKWLFQSNNY